MKAVKYALIVAIFFSIGAWKPVEEESAVKWLTFEEAIELHKKEPKKLLIDMYTDWCGWCKRMDATTYSDAQLAAYIDKNFYPIKFNAEQKGEVVFDGHTFKFVPSGRRGYHELAAALMQNKLSYPTTVFMDEKLRIIQPLPGYLTAKQMEPIVSYIGGDHYKNTPWPQYKKEYKSSL